MNLLLVLSLSASVTASMPAPSDFSAEAATRYAQMTSTPTFDLKRLVDEGILPQHYAQSDDPQRLVPMIIDPAMIDILVAGDPGRNQSRGYMNNHMQGPPTSRRIELPRKWDELLAGSRRPGS